MAPTRFQFEDRADARYCPACGGAFRPEFDRCRRCDAALISRGQAERIGAQEENRGHDPGDFGGTEVAVATLGDPAEVEFVRGTLAEAGIPHRIDHHLIPQFGVADSAFGAELWVMEQDAAAARQILADLDLEVGQTEPVTTGETPLDEVEDAENEEQESGPHRLSRSSIRLRVLRMALLGSALWAIFWAAVWWGAGSPLDAALNLLVGIAFLALWRLSGPAPRRAFAIGAVLVTIILIHDVAVGWIDPSLRATPTEIVGTALFVLAMYWGWQSAPD